MELEYIHAKYLGWSRPRSTRTSMSGYIGPAKDNMSYSGFSCVKGEIVHAYRLEIRTNGECYVPDLTKNRKRLQKRVQQGLFKILTPNIDLDEKSPCDVLIKTSQAQNREAELLAKIEELKGQAAEKETVKTPVRRGRKKSAQNTIKANKPLVSARKEEEVPETKSPGVPVTEGAAPDME